MPITIPVPSKLRTATAPTSDSDLVNKKYVDDQIETVRAEIPSGEPEETGPPTALTDSSGTYTAECPTLSANTYLAKQGALAPEYDGSTAYVLGAVCTYHGKLWTRTSFAGQAGLAPEGMAVQGWTETSLLNVMPSDVSLQRRTIRQLTSTQIDLADDAAVFILPSQSNATVSLLHMASVSNPLSPSYWGTNLIDIQLFIPMTVQATAFKWNTLDATWIRGNVSDLVANKTHIVRLRILPQLALNTPGVILAELLGSYPTPTF